MIGGPVSARGAARAPGRPAARIATRDGLSAAPAVRYDPAVGARRRRPPAVPARPPRLPGRRAQEVPRCARLP